jgi:hypothetical protein
MPNMIGAKPRKPDDTIRTRGTMIWASPGAGKTRLLRFICWCDFFDGISCALLDPVDQSIDQFCSKIADLPEDIRRKVIGRIRYVDMSGKSNIVPFPLYYRLGSETHLEVSSRFLEIVKICTPAYLHAPVQGWPAVQHIGSHVGVILSSLGLQISAAPALLNNSEAFFEQFSQFRLFRTCRGRD